jgi:hypothetical protein
MSLFLLIIIYKLLIDVREVKTRFKLIKHIDTEKALEVAPGNAVVTRARRWRPQVNGRKNNNKSKLLGRAEFTRRPGA